MANLIITLYRLPYRVTVQIRQDTYYVPSVTKKHGTHVVCQPEVPCGVY